MGWNDKVRDDCYLCRKIQGQNYTHYYCALQEDWHKDCPCQVSIWEDDFECKFFISVDEVQKEVRNIIDKHICKHQKGYHKWKSGLK